MRIRSRCTASKRIRVIHVNQTFKPLKNEWRKAVSEWRVGHPFSMLNQLNFSDVLSTVIKNLNPETVKDGYRNTGLFLFDENAVHYERLTATNQRNFDSRAFSLSSENSTISENEASLKVIEAVLGETIAARYRDVENLTFVDLNLLPNVISYLIWKHLVGLTREVEHKELQVTMLEDVGLNPVQFAEGSSLIQLKQLTGVSV